MKDMTEKQLEEIFAKAIRNTIEQIGLDKFKQTSFFGSNLK